MEQRQYIGKYKVLKQLGQGGEGNVYLVRDEILDRLAAVKKLQPQRGEVRVKQPEEQEGRSGKSSEKQEAQSGKRTEEQEKQSGKSPEEQEERSGKSLEKREERSGKQPEEVEEQSEDREEQSGKNPKEQEKQSGKSPEEMEEQSGKNPKEQEEQPDKSTEKWAEQLTEREQPELHTSVTREAEMLQRLRHPMLPVVYEVFQEDGWYLAMEYIQGITLREYVERNGYVRERQACVWTDELLDVLGYLHTRKPPVIYRDLKPDNIMVCSDGHLRLVDFGAACRQEFGVASDGLMAATPGYGAPEQFGRTGDGIRADERSDIYALGKVLYYMVTGSDPARPPYVSLSIRDYQHLLTPDLERIIRKCIEDETTDRYQTVCQVRNDLGECGRGKPCMRRRSFIRVVEKQVWLTEK